MPRFKTFEEIYKWVGDSKTNYETEKGITCIKSIVALDSKTLKVVFYMKSDYTVTAMLYFNANIKNPSWVFWTPSKEQIAMFPSLWEIFNQIDKQNLDKKIKWEF